MLQYARVGVEWGGGGGHIAICPREDLSSGVGDVNFLLSFFSGI